MNNKKYLIALNRLKNVGPVTIAGIMATWPRLSDLQFVSMQDLIASGVRPSSAKLISNLDFTATEADLRWEESAENHIITLEDPRYPSLLREIHDPPVVLYVRGDPEVLKGPIIAMVGTRNPSPAGAETAYRFARKLGDNQIVVASGLALGIDERAHSGCLASGGKTIAVSGCGIDYIYPQRHARLYHKIIQNGLIISEFPPGTPPAAGHFPRRNRIISGISCSVLVVEAAMRSGSLVTARLALEENREVLAVPGSIYNPVAEGCHHLLRQGARLVESVDDILVDLPIFNDIRAEKMDPLVKEEENLVKCMGFEIATVDDIVERSGLPVEQVICELTDLEMQGIIKAVPGGYARCIL